MGRWLAGLRVRPHHPVHPAVNGERRFPVGGRAGAGQAGADLVRDLHHAGRMLRRRPGFALLAVAVMALGIGANTAVFSVVDAVLLKPLPYAGADRLVTLSTALLDRREINPLVVAANVRDWRSQSRSFETMATYVQVRFPVLRDDGAEYADGAIVEPQFFRVFHVTPVLGRTLTPEESAAGDAVLISHAYWQSRFGGDATVLQRTLRLDSGPNLLPIVGVLPPGFRFPNETAIWLVQTNRATSRTRHNRLAVGRLAPDVTVERAQAELTTIAAELERQYPDSNKGRGVSMMPLQDALVGDVRFTLYLLWGVVGIVLLIACANTATLLLGKATVRLREMAVRRALGASRARIVRQLITESALLAGIAGALGLMLAYWGTRVLLALAPADVIRRADVGIDAGVLLFTLAVSLATSVLFGLVPALHASRVDFTDATRLGGTRAVAGGRLLHARGLLVVVEIALAAVLLTGAGLLTRSLIALHGVDLGFQASNVLVMRATGVRAIRENNAFFTDVMARLASLPGVTAVGATSIPPMDLTNAGDGAYYIDRRPQVRDRATEPRALFTVVAPGTFAALGIPLRRGRDFAAGDTFDRPLVAIVNEALVRRSFGGENPIGRTIFCNFDRPNDGMTIVGVVGDVRQRNPALAPIPECYLPYRQHSYNNATLNVVVRTVGEPAALAGSVRRVAAAVSADVPVSFTTMEATLDAGRNGPEFRSLLFGFFAAIALCLAMAGVYGVMAYAVEQRSSEIGVRIALGASRRSVLQMILGQSLVLAATGLAVGLSLALAATRLLTSLLFEVRPLDPATFLGVAFLLGGLTLTAGFLPARRATVINPITVLRAE